MHLRLVPHANACGKPMAGQIPTRREVLQALTLASLASFAPRFTRWSCAQEIAGHHQAATLVTPAAQEKAPYQPVAFSAEQYVAMRRLCDIILPADGDAPGAETAGVSEFVDFMMAHDPDTLRDYHHGLQAVDRLSQNLYGSPFAQLMPEQATAVLTRLAYKQHARPGDESARAFFRLARKYAVMGFYTSEIGFQALDSPNLKFYSESPGCPDPKSTTHRHAEAAHA